MQTDAWLRKDLQTGLASWTELKHDTVLYVKQPTGFGGGGPPLTSFGYVEPNPLVFARIAVVATLTYQGLEAQGFTVPVGEFFEDTLITSLNELRTTRAVARLAEIARMELAGEPLSRMTLMTRASTTTCTCDSHVVAGRRRAGPVRAGDGCRQQFRARGWAARGGRQLGLYLLVVTPARWLLQLTRGGVFQTTSS